MLCYELLLLLTDLIENANMEVILCLSFVHRPVVALIEVEVYRVQKDKRARVRDDVAAALGPPDPTVLVQEKEEGASVNISQLLETFRKVWRRCVGESYR